MLAPVLKKNDKQAAWLIGIFSVVVFAVVVSLGRIKLNVNVGFNVHIFAAANAIINSVIAVLLIAALVAVKQNNYLLHKRLMLDML